MIICHVYFFSFSYVLFPAVVTQIFNLIAEFEIPVGIPTKKAIKKIRNWNASSNCRNYNKWVINTIQNSVDFLMFLTH